jgi:deazaflavin-dependent oxidoreductase (nitroreductase family)
MAPRIHHLDKTMLRLTGGNYTISELAGWPVIELTTIGAKTQQRRTMPLLALINGEKIGLVASSFGRSQHPGWYYNLKAHPECEVRYRGKPRKYLAHQAEGQEREDYWRMAVSYYAGYEKYRERAARRIPVMVLEPSREP